MALGKMLVCKCNLSNCLRYSLVPMINNHLKYVERQGINVHYLLLPKIVGQKSIMPICDVYTIGKTLSNIHIMTLQYNLPPKKDILQLHCYYKIY
jgi:hypothetical protein